MARPIRIEYQNAFYHVMNRGRGRQAVYHGDTYYKAFLDILEEACQEFGAVIHAYCLMGNHYHLLVQTPNANLGRVMRHVNGVYTQRYNWLKNTDGSMFRGRYKAILIHDKEYFLQLTRYIHRNPVETRKPLAEDLADYPWSSYPAYLDRTPAPAWLHRDKAYEMLGEEDKIRAYRDYVEGESTEFDDGIFAANNPSVILGDQVFRLGLIRNLLDEDTMRPKVTRASLPVIEDIISAVAQIYSVDSGEIVTRARLRANRNMPRRVAIYCCYEYGKISHANIAVAFDISSASYVSNVVFDIRRRLGKGELRDELRLIEERILVR